MKKLFRVGLMLTIAMVSVCATKAQDSTLKKQPLVSLGVGHLANDYAASIELRINKDGDEIRLLNCVDYYYPINKVAILYQPYIKPLVWRFKPIVAIGPSIGKWRTRAMGYSPWFPDRDPNTISPWKKNPVIMLDGLAGMELDLGIVAMDIYYHYSLLLTANEFGSPRLGYTLKFQF